jgi:hypothetical protein
VSAVSFRATKMPDSCRHHVRASGMVTTDDMWLVVQDPYQLSCD